MWSDYSGLYILKPPIQLGIYGIQLHVVLKWSDIYSEKESAITGGQYYNWEILKLQAFKS